MLNESYKTDPSLSILFTELNKEYFHFKQNLQSKGKTVFNDNLNILFELIDKQHLLLKVLEQDNRTLSDELSYRKLIIERKSAILKDLNLVVLNKFIDRNYKQEIEINQLKAEINQLKFENKKVEMNGKKQLTIVSSLPEFFNEEKPKSKQINVYQCYKEKSKNINKNSKEEISMHVKSSTGYPAMHTSVNVNSSQTLINLYKCYLNTPKAKLTKMKTSKYWNIKNNNNNNIQ